MPVGHPDSSRRLGEDRLETHVDRLIREAMEAGQFDELKGVGRPIPGAGTKDDDLWWVRSWLQRNSDLDRHPPSSSL